MRPVRQLRSRERVQCMSPTIGVSDVQTNDANSPGKAPVVWKIESEDRPDWSGASRTARTTTRGQSDNVGQTWSSRHNADVRADLRPTRITGQSRGQNAGSLIRITSESLPGRRPRLIVKNMAITGVARRGVRIRRLGKVGVAVATRSKFVRPRKKHAHLHASPGKRRAG